MRWVYYYAMILGFFLISVDSVILTPTTIRITMHNLLHNFTPFSSLVKFSSFHLFYSMSYPIQNYHRSRFTIRISISSFLLFRYSWVLLITFFILFYLLLYHCFSLTKIAFVKDCYRFDFITFKFV